MGIYFPSFRAYIEDANDLCDKIDRLDTVIDSLITLATTSALEDDVSEYRLDDGQTVIRVERRSVEQLMLSIRRLQLVRNSYIGQLNGRTMRLVNHEDNRFLTFNDQ